MEQDQTDIAHYFCSLTARAFAKRGRAFYDTRCIDGFDFYTILFESRDCRGPRADGQYRKLAEQLLKFMIKRHYLALQSSQTGGYVYVPTVKLLDHPAWKNIIPDPRGFKRWIVTSRAMYEDD